MDDRPDPEALRLTAQEVAAEWGLELGRAFALGRYSFVAPAGDDAVLKVTPAADYDADHEADALAQWGGRGAMRLLRRDDRRRALLVERARPGVDISAVPEERATSIAVAVGLELWQTPPAPPLRPVAEMVERWLAGAPARAGLVPLARELLDELDVGARSLVHGDFHHHNIVSDGPRHVAIDPKPYAADPEFDVPTFLWNPLSYRLTNRELTERRIGAFVTAGLDDAKIRVWTVIRAAYLGAEPEEEALIRSLV